MNKMRKIAEGFGAVCMLIKRSFDDCIDYDAYAVLLTKSKATF